MAEPQPTVFLSYRRNIASFHARAIFLHLCQYGYDVFMDVENIHDGKFETIIRNQIAARTNFLVILTYGTLARCQEPDDWLRREIEWALELKRNVVPIFVEDFKIENEPRAHLPGKLCELPQYNGLHLPHNFFNEAMERLRQHFLRLPTQEIITTTPPQDASVVEQKIEEAARQPTPTQQELSAEDYFNRGFALNDDSDKKIEYYMEALRLNPQYTVVYYYRGNARQAKGDLAGAIADFQQYLAFGGGMRDGKQKEIEQRIRDLQAQLSAAPLPWKKIAAYASGVMSVMALLVLAILPQPPSQLPSQPPSQPLYRLMCDASAAVALDADHFIVANDSRNKLLIYKRDIEYPVESVDISSFLGIQPEKASDLEGAARIGDRIYWISSHSRNKSAKYQEERHRFFATDVQTKQEGVTVVPVGKAYTALHTDLIAAPQLRQYELAEAEKLAPEVAGGFNIEGLAATPDSKLLIGFRNPIRSQKALVVPLENPAAVIEGKRAQFGTPIELDLGGRGIRSIELVGSSYVISAGPRDVNGSFKIYRWSGKADNVPNEIQGIDLQGLRPEALFTVPQMNTIQILSDDGGEQIDGQDCNDQDRARQSLRSISITP